MWSNTFAKSRSGRLRRRRRSFAGAEPLEPRALLSAVTADLSAAWAAAIDSFDLVPPVPAEVSLINCAHSNVVNDGVFDRVLAPSRTLGFDSDSTSLSFGLDSLVNLASSVAALASSNATVRFSPMDDHSIMPSISELSARTVEIRIAETGQVLSFGAASSMHDDSGLTISDGHGPTTYLRTTDVDGRIQSRLVFVTRAPSSVLAVEAASPIVDSGAVTADAEFSESSRLGEWASRADLHDLATALEVNNGAATPPTSAAEALILAASGSVRTAPTARAAIELLQIVALKADANSDAHDTQPTREFVASSPRGNDRDTEPQSSSPAWPVFDPTTRNIVLSMCLIGSLVRASARHRRRQRAATALT